MERVTIFDSTLRDGSQAEGISFSVEDKIRIVEVLDELGVDYIEAGNPSSNIKELEFFKQASKLKLNHSKIVAFGSTRRCHIDAEADKGLKALLDANTKIVSIFGKSSLFHVRDILKTTEEENLNMIFSSIAYLVKNGREVFFDAEHFFDGYKNSPEYAIKTLKVACEAGCSAVVLCDTNGGSFPTEVAEIVNVVKKEINVTIGIHTHDDTGQAVANSCIAVYNGARQVQGTLIGIGERCGNTNLSTIIGNLEGKQGYTCLPPNHLSLLKDCCTKVAEISNMSIFRNMPYIGRSAFAHKAGMHIDAVIKSSSSFEHINPDLVGNSRRFLLSEVAGKGTIYNKLVKMDPNIKKDDKIVSLIVDKVKELEFSGYQFEGADASFELLTLKTMGKFKPFFKLESFKVITDPSIKESSASALIKISVDDKIEMTAAEGDGPVNALDSALRKALNVFYPEVEQIRLIDYKVRIINTNTGTKATTRVLISSTDGKETWTTVGLSTDIINASWIALVDSVEYKLYKSGKETK